MSKLKKKLRRRILAYILTGAMIVSSSGMTALANQPSKDTIGGYYRQTDDTRDDGDIENAEEIENNVNDIADSEKEDKGENNKDNEDESSEVDKSSEDESSEVDKSSEDESSEVDKSNENESSEVADPEEEEREKATQIVWDFKNNKYIVDESEKALGEGFETIENGKIDTGTLKGLKIDATASGTKAKFDLRTSDVQINADTSVKIPVYGKSKITIVSNSNYYYYEVDEVAAEKTTEEFTGVGDYAELVATGTAYLYSITVDKYKTAKVKGSVTLTPEVTEEAVKVIFTEKVTSGKAAVVEAEIKDDNSYEADLYVGSTYTVSLSNRDYIVDKEIEVEDETEMNNVDITATEVTTTEVTGKIKDAPSNLEITVTSAKKHNPEVKIAGDTYTVNLEPDTDYTVTATGTRINDYDYTDTINSTRKNNDITFTEKTKYRVNITVDSYDKKTDWSSLKPTFTNKSETGYSYDFTDMKDVSLRSGTYTITEMNVEYPYFFDYSKTIKVEDADVDVTLNFSERMSWDFSNKNDLMLTAAAINGEQNVEHNYNGLMITKNANNIRFDTSGGQIQVGEGIVIKIPVSGKGTIQVVTAGTNYTHYTIGEETATKEDATYTYDVTGEEEGQKYVTLTSTNNQLYIKKIVVTRSEEEPDDGSSGSEENPEGDGSSGSEENSEGDASSSSEENPEGDASSVPEESKTDPSSTEESSEVETSTEEESQPTKSDTVEDKITADKSGQNKKIKMDDAEAIKIWAADIIENKKTTYAVSVTYTYDTGEKTKDGDPITYQQQLTEGIHYEVEKKENEDGEHYVIVYGLGETDLGIFMGSAKSNTYKIRSSSEAKTSKANDISKAKLTLDYKSATFTGNYITPGVTVTAPGDKTKTLVENTDYTVVYKNNVNVGKASVTVIGKGDYFGSATATFTIKAANLAKSTVNIKADNITEKLVNDASKKGKVTAVGDFKYAGEAITFKNLKLELESDNGKTVSVLSPSTYTVTYKKNNTAQSTATATIKGLNNVSGTITVSYDIDNAVNSDTIKALETSTATTPLLGEYSSKGVRLTEIKVDGIILKENADYKANYKECKKDPVMDDIEKVSISGLGSYKKVFDNIPVQVKVGQGKFHLKKSGVTVDKSKIYDKSGNLDLKKLISAAKITDAAGVAIKPDDINSDPTKIVIENNKITLEPSNTNNYETTDLKDIHVATKITAALKQNNKVNVLNGYFDGVNTATTTETKIIDTLEHLKATPAVLTTPEITANDISIVSYKNNHKLGNATVTIQATDSSAYYGTMNVKFTITAVSGADRMESSDDPEDPKLRTEWNFRKGSDLMGENGVKIEGGTGIVEGLEIDATSGKFDSTGEDWAQVNAGTIIRVPVAGASKVTVTVYDSNSKYTVDGKENTTEEESFLCEGTEGYVTIVMTSDGYIGSIKVVPIDPSEIPEDGDYGTVEETEDSLFLYLGPDSIILSGAGTIISATKYEGLDGTYVTEGLKDDNGKAQLRYPRVNLADYFYKGFNAVDLYVGYPSAKGSAEASIKVGDIEIAKFDEIAMGTNSNDWSPIKVTTTLISSDDVKNASGKVFVDITKKSGTYCGNFAYIRLYNDPSISNDSSGGDIGEPIYLDESRTFEERAADLVARMTVQEKIAQLQYQSPAISRLDVSSYNYWREALHGIARQGKATSFPTALSMSNTWNPELIQSMADVISDEARGKNNRYNLSYWSPTVNMARDPRWGRNEEGYGEDPYLAGQIGAAFIKGLQGTDDADNGGYLKTIATFKHFAANNNETNRRGGSSKMTEFHFRNYYTRVFQNITEEVMPASAMASYNATTIYRNGEILYNYIPSAANPYLLQQVLRRNWGFDGYVTSDCGAGDDLVNRNEYKNGLLGNTTSDKGAYLAEAFKNGLNVECYLSGYNAVSNDGIEMVEKGYLTTGELDRAVYELFLQRFKTGEFDQDGGKYRKITSSDIESQAHIDKAEEVAEETWVLLENKNNALPLNGEDSVDDGKYNVVVVGNLAGAALLGDYTGAPEKVVYPIDGIRTAVQGKFSGAQVDYLSAVADDEKLFNIKSINLVFENGSKKSINLSNAIDVRGMTAEGGIWKDITPSAGATFKDVDITNLATIEVEMAAGTRVGGSIDFAISDGPAICSVSSKPTTDTDTYVVCSAKSTGKDGGYDGIRDLYISFGADSTFSVEKYKDKLDSADVIIVYAGTIPKQTTYNVSGDSDSAESKDRKDIEIPEHQKHVKDICSVDAYASKAILVMSTVGQVNIEQYKDKCAAVLWTSYNGQTQGTALGKVLVGDVNPSGRLTTTWYKNADVQKMEVANTTTQNIGGISGKYTDYDIQPHGDDPGHTYQYYKNTPVYPFGYGKSYTSFNYSNIRANTSTNVGPNDKISFSIDVKNSGNRDGKEVVQLYVKYPELTGDDLKAFDQNLMPKKQLKGFKKVEISAGESKTVTIELNVRDMYLFSEKLQKDFVPNGTYTVYIGKDASDESQTVQFTVTGNLESKIKTVKAIPDGILLKGRIDENGENLTTDNEIKPNLSTVMTDESILFDDSTGIAVPNSVTVEYISDNPEIAVVNENNAIVSGSKPGTTYITAKVTYNGEEKETTFPVVNEVSYKPSQNEINNALKKLEESFETYKEADYSAANWKELQKIKTDAEAAIKAAETMADVNLLLGKAIGDMKEIIAKKDIEDAKAQINEAYNELYNRHTFYKEETFAKITKIKDDGLSSVESILKKSELKNKISEVIENMNAIEVDNLTTDKDVYKLSSKNDKHIVNGIIDYREGGIAPYVIDGYKISGTITNNAPNNDIEMQVSDGNSLIKSNIIWQIEKLDKSSRKVADIDRDTGRLTIYGNGLVRITAIDTQNDKYGTLDVYVNTQIEGEYADEANGAKLNDVKNNASGLSAETNGIGNNAGSTKDYWIKYKSVRLKNIEDIYIRYSNKDKDPQKINVAVDDGKGGKNIIATLTSAAGSGQWYNWEPDTKFTINKEKLNAVTLDANGCADIYIQSNALNFDYFRLTYTDSASAAAASYSDTVDVSNASSVSEESSNADTPVQTINWGTSEILLTKNNVTGATKIWNLISDSLKTEVNLEYFAESDVDYSKIDLKINCLAVYKDRVYAGCDNGLVVVITECPKCYKLKKVSSIDIKSMSISGETMTVSNGTKSINLNMTDIGGDSIEIDEANALEAKGGVLVDVRSAEEFAEKSVSGSVNIPVDDIQEGLASYSKDTILIFYCASGTRANEAVKKAKDMGFTNVYNLGSIKKFGL